MSGRDERKTTLNEITKERIVLKLQDILIESGKKGKSILVTSNSLANQYILGQWGYRPSQRRQFKDFFNEVRKQCSEIFHQLLSETKIEWEEDQGTHFFGIHKFDEIRGNLILGFVEIVR